ncbi:MAG TPA: lysophospholipid acyltransferase family protein [Steroidobacteraceae bacterium]|nr:lysophospholipid acyltransferase family protein [Steroidobacteraceae bacterium]
MSVAGERAGGGARSPGSALQLAGSLLFTGFLFAWTFLYAIVLVVACAVLPFPRRFAMARAYAATVLAVLRWTCGLDYRLEGAPLPAGCHVALWKHSSSWETIAMMVVFPRQVWVLKRELLWVPAVGLGVRLLHAIAIDRKAGHTAVAQVIEQGKQRLEEGDWVIIFPEGTRMAPGETRRYGVSGTLLAGEAGKLIVPVAHNAGFFWPRRGLLKKPGTVRVVIGEPVNPAGREVREVNEEIQAWVEATVRTLDPAHELRSSADRLGGVGR